MLCSPASGNGTEEQIRFLHPSKEKTLCHAKSMQRTKVELFRNGKRCGFLSYGHLFLAGDC
jgi:hypothetical protein